MKIVGLRTGEKRQMVPRMRVQRAEYGQGEPQPCRRHVRSHNKHAQERWEEIRENVFDGVAVDGRHRNRSRPFVMLFVNIFVDMLAMKKPK